MCLLFELFTGVNSLVLLKTDISISHSSPKHRGSPSTSKSSKERVRCSTVEERGRVRWQQKGYEESCQETSTGGAEVPSQGPNGQTDFGLRDGWPRQGSQNCSQKDTQRTTEVRICNVQEIINEAFYDVGTIEFDKVS